MKRDAARAPMRLAVSALLAWPCLAWSTDQITWSISHYPAIQIRIGPHQNSGSFDGLLETLIADLPGLQHEQVVMTVARRDEELRRGRNICTPSIFRTPERERVWVFSRPALLHLDNRLVFLRREGGHFPAGDIDLAALLRRTELRGGVLAGRSYAPSVDPLIARFADSPNLTVRSMPIEQFFDMLVTGRLDYLILFSHEASFLASKLGLGDAALERRHINGVPPYSYTHVACTKNDWGRAMIGKIDAVLDARRATPAYRAYSERWHSPDDVALVRRYYPQMLKDAGQP